MTAALKWISEERPQERNWLVELRMVAWDHDEVGFLRLADQAHDDGLGDWAIAEIAEEGWPRRGRTIVEDYFGKKADAFLKKLDALQDNPRQEVVSAQDHIPEDHQPEAQDYQTAPYVPEEPESTPRKLPLVLEQKLREIKTKQDAQAKSGSLPVVFQHQKSPSGFAQSFENALAAVDSLGIECRYDLFHDKIVIDQQKLDMKAEVANNLENVTLKIRQKVLDEFEFDPGAQYTFDALRARCMDHLFDPVKDYLDGLQWDGVPRIDGWLQRYIRAEDTPLNRMIGRKMLIAAVRRVKQPGCKFDHIVVWEGAQGQGKSTALRVLAGDENYSDAEIIGLDKREQQEADQGIWIYELAEFEGLSRTEMSSIKVFASKQVDRARPAYGRSRVDRQRRCIFVATTNEDDYLRDKTGNRRFWPVKVIGECDLDALVRDRDQLWAEAVVLEAGGEELVIPREMWPLAEVEQKKRMAPDAWEDAIETRLSTFISKGKNLEGIFCSGGDEAGNPVWRISSEYLLTEVLNLPLERRQDQHTKRLKATMRLLGWERAENPMWFGKVQKRGYWKSCKE
jgi:predicted P-loop ATPase